MNTRKYPRTMVEAFGPYEGNSLYIKPEPMHMHDKIVLIACTIVIPVLVASIFIWS